MEKGVDSIPQIFEYKSGYTFKAIVMNFGLKIELIGEQDDFGIELPMQVVDELVEWWIKKREELKELRELRVKNE